MSAELRDVTARPIVRRPWMLIPPPLLFSLALILGTLLNRFIPLPLLPTTLVGLAWWLGIVLVLLWASLMVGCFALFGRARTTIVPHHSPKNLVTSGPYRFTRNPMYLSLTLLYLGVTALVNTLWPLLFLWLPLWVLQTRVIPFEEHMLANAFGSQYAAYSARVRRWL